MGNTRTPLRDSLLEAARATGDVLRRDADRSERDGTLTAASVEALVESGVFRAFLPTELRGHEADPLTLIELVEAVTQHDGSAGWCTGMGGIITGIAAAMLPEEGVGEVFSDPENAVFAGGFPPMGRAVVDGDGHRVSGRFRFGSGCRHASWMVLTCIVEGAEPTPGAAIAMRSFCVPRDRVEIHDNWQVAGLEGTASCDYSVENEFVPRAFSFAMGVDPALRGSGLFALPILSIAAVPHSGFALGMGAQTLDDVRNHATRKRLGSAAPLAERPVFQSGFARAATKLSAARALVFEGFGALWSTYLEGGAISLDQRAAAAAATTNAYDVATEAATFAYRAGGASALFRSERLQRGFRDIQAGAQHIVASEENWERVGQVYLGVGKPMMI